MEVFENDETDAPGLEGDLLYDSYFTIHYSMAGWMAVSF